MNEREALLQAVCDNPDDDTPRLVFADWLQENGDEAQAEFIRLQIGIAGSPGGSGAPGQRAREKALLATHQKEWTRPFKEFEGYRTGEYYVFRRGFVEALGSDGEIMVDQGDRLFELAPIRELHLADEEEHGALAACEWLLRLHTLDLTGSGLSRNFVPAPLLTSRFLASLTTLRLCGEDDNGHLDIQGLEALGRNEHLVNIRALDLSNNWFGPDGIAPIVRSAWLPGLRRLELEGAGIANEGIDWLAAATRFDKLRELNLVANSIGDRGGQRLLNTQWFAQLDLLDFRDHLGESHIDEPLTPETADLLKQRFGDRIRL